MEDQDPAKAQAIARWQGAARRAWHDTVRLICTKDKLAVALRDDVGRQANPEVWQQGLNDAMAEVDQDLLALDRTITEAEQELAGGGGKAPGAGVQGPMAGGPGGAPTQAQGPGPIRKAGPDAAVVRSDVGHGRAGQG